MLAIMGRLYCSLRRTDGRAPCEMVPRLVDWEDTSSVRQSVNLYQGFIGEKHPTRGCIFCVECSYRLDGTGRTSEVRVRDHHPDRPAPFGGPLRGRLSAVHPTRGLY